MPPGIMRVRSLLSCAGCISSPCVLAWALGFFEAFSHVASFATRHTLVGCTCCVCCVVLASSGVLVFLGRRLRGIQVSWHWDMFWCGAYQYALIPRGGASSDPAAKGLSFLRGNCRAPPFFHRLHSSVACLAASDGMVSIWLAVHFLQTSFAITTLARRSHFGEGGVAIRPPLPRA